jgi:hypothetical protein
MDLSKPEMAIGVLNATVTLSSIGYFHYKNVQVEKKLVNISDDITLTNDNLVELEGKVDKWDRDFDLIRNFANKTSKQIKLLQSVIIEQQETIDQLKKLLIKKDEKVNRIETDLFDLNNYDRNDNDNRDSRKEKDNRMDRSDSRIENRSDRLDRRYQKDFKEFRDNRDLMNNSEMELK